MAALPEAERNAQLALALVPGLGPKLTRALLERFGTASAVLELTAPQLKTVPLIGETLATSFAESFRTVDVAKELVLLTKHAVTPVLLGDVNYPARLATLPDAPSLMYLKGLPTLADENAIGIVGSRSCTAYGKRIAASLATGFARAGWTVVSGLARGIDGAAHKGSLDAGGRTIAVLAGGLSRIYPPEHADLADAVSKQGYLITETPMTVQPQPGMFPARNRIISALSKAVIVVEANAKSGALITVDHAREQGRPVFAVPGNVDSEASAGCLELIRAGAKLVRNADDVLMELGTTTKVMASLFDAPVKPEGMDLNQEKIWTALDGTKHVDDIARETGLSITDLSRLLMTMELKRLIRRLPGNTYERR